MSFRVDMKKISENQDSEVHEGNEGIAQAGHRVPITGF